MDLIITFCKSRSAQFGQIIKECNKFKDFTLLDGIYKLQIEYLEILENWESFSLVLNNAITWSSFGFKIKGRLVAHKSDIKKIFYDLQDLMYCIKEFQVVNDQLGYCNQTFWGCNKLDSVHVLPNYYSKHKGWYLFGTLDQGAWKIDKDRILNTLLKEAELKHLDKCPNFKKERIQEVVDALPASIDIATKHWKMVTTIQFKDGAFKQVCTGIEWIGNYIDFKPEEILHQ